MEERYVEVQKQGVEQHFNYKQSKDIGNLSSNFKKTKKY